MEDTDWHAQAVDDVLQRLASSRAGLSHEEAARRLADVGPNRLARTKRVPALRVFVNQRTSVVVFLLAAAALVALALGDRIESAAIAAVLALNTAIGFVTELRARRAMDALVHSKCSADRTRWWTRSSRRLRDCPRHCLTDRRVSGNRARASRLTGRVLFAQPDGSCIALGQIGNALVHADASGPPKA